MIRGEQKVATPAVFRCSIKQDVAQGEQIGTGVEFNASRSRNTSDRLSTTLAGRVCRFLQSSHNRFIEGVVGNLTSRFSQRCLQ